MADSVPLPLWKGLTDADLGLPSISLVEFETQTLWYELIASLAIQALRASIPTDVHIFQRPISDAVELLTREGFDVPALLASGQLRLIDSYSVQMGVPATAAPGADAFMVESVNLADWSEAIRPLLGGGATAGDSGRLHLDGNIAVLTSYNSEADVINFWRTRLLPLFRQRGCALVAGVGVGIASDSFYRQLEAMVDTIIELAADEGEQGLDQKVRIKSSRGRRVDTRWRPVHLSPTGEVLLGIGDVGPVAPASPDIVSVLSRSALESDLRRYLDETSEVKLSQYQVVGAYTRFDEAARNLLKDFRQRLVGAFQHPKGKPENFLLWAPPGSGKTFFVHELAQDLGGAAAFEELNLASSDESTFRTRLAAASASARPSLIFVDEVDSQPTASWPYELLLPALEPPNPRPAPVAFVLAGSAGGSIQELKDALRARPKGPDLLSRVPAANELPIPPVSREDRLLVALSTLRDAAAREGRPLREVEKLALFYIALSPRLASPRQLREFCLQALGRAPASDDRVKFDYFFPAGDAESKEFFVGVRSAASELVGSYVRLGG